MTLLERRIRDLSIPKWPAQPVFDRILVYKIPEDAASRETFIPGGKLLKPDTIKDKEKRHSPRGILCAAGLTAMDHLRSHGIGLGHIVWLARFSEWRHVVDRNEHGDIEFWFLRSGDIVHSEDLLVNMEKRKVSVAVGKDGKHHLSMDDSEIPRFDPPTYADDL
jgi:hypothetical protein